MFAYIEGKLVYKEPTYVVLDVNGIGYEIKISLNTYSILEDTNNQEIFHKGKCRLQTYLQVKEDGHTLYGFPNPEDKQLFMTLISVSGIGTNTAMLMLSSLSSEEIQEAILQGNVATIQSVKGIGGKTAQRVILELKDKIQKTMGQSLPDLSAQDNEQRQKRGRIREDAVLSLVALGINKNVAEKNIDKIMKKNTDIKLEELIKLALKN